MGRAFRGGGCCCMPAARFQPDEEAVLKEHQRDLEQELADVVARLERVRGEKGERSKPAE